MNREDSTRLPDADVVTAATPDPSTMLVLELTAELVAEQAQHIDAVERAVLNRDSPRAVELRCGAGASASTYHGGFEENSRLASLIEIAS